MATDQVCLIVDDLPFQPGEFWQPEGARASCNVRMERFRLVPEEVFADPPRPVPVPTRWPVAGDAGAVPAWVWKGGRLHPVVVALHELRLFRGTREVPAAAVRHLELLFHGRALDVQQIDGTLLDDAAPRKASLGGRLHVQVSAPLIRRRGRRVGSRRGRRSGGGAPSTVVAERPDAPALQRPVVVAAGGPASPPPPPPPVVAPAPRAVLDGGAVPGVRRVLLDRRGRQLGSFSSEDDLMPFYGRTLTVRELVRSCGCSVRTLRDDAGDVDDG